MTKDTNELPRPNTAPSQTSATTETPNSSGDRQGSNRVLYSVLAVFLLAQCAFVGYAHWFVTQGLPNALDDVSDSDLLRDVRALTESSLQGLRGPGNAALHDPLLPPDPQAKNNGSIPAPNAPFVQPDQEVSVNDLLDIVESLSHDLDEQLRALEDPSYTPRPPGSGNNSLVPPGDGVAFRNAPPHMDVYL